ncbi:MAG: DUF805 domain-containing protein [Candidatus Kapabacteria bacterium]|nr:DUF805 domain-containing protein [Candidatus Kapabacteria bacterium]
MYSDDELKLKIKELFPPKGRLRQRDFIIYQFLLFIVLIVTYLAAIAGVPFVFFLIFFLIMVEIYITAKRLQDCNFSGLFSLFILIPTINVLGVLFLLIYPATKGENEYGNDPREQNIIT